MSVVVVDGTGTPSQSPLPGPNPGANLGGLVQRLSDNLGYKTTNARFKAACITWIQDTLLEIQLCDPKMGRVYVLDAAVTLTSGQADYDVRSSPFSWGNCYAVSMLKVPELENRVLERVTPEQYRHRGVLSADSGPPSYFVQLDQFRVRFVPTPGGALSLVGDYQQNIPQIANDTDRIDWPRAWDIVLIEGCLYRGYKWRSEQDGTWVTQRRVFRELLKDLEKGENMTTREPGKVVMTRGRRGSQIPHDNSADIRWRR